MINAIIETLNKIKGSLISNKQCALPSIIGYDLMQSGKLSLCLFSCIIVTAMMVVTTTHYTRLLTAQCDQLVLKRDALDVEWRNLILEENTLGAHNRVEWIAMEKLKLQYVDPSQENIIIRK